MAETASRSKPSLSLSQPVETPPPSPWRRPLQSPNRAVTDGFKQPDSAPSSLEMLRLARGRGPQPRRRRGAPRRRSRLTRRGRWGGRAPMVREGRGARSIADRGGGWRLRRRGRSVESAQSAEAEEAGRHRGRGCSKLHHARARVGASGLSGVPPSLVGSGSVPSSNPPR